MIGLYHIMLGKNTKCLEYQYQRIIELVTSLTLSSSGTTTMICLSRDLDLLLHQEGSHKGTNVLYQLLYALSSLELVIIVYIAAEIYHYSTYSGKKCQFTQPTISVPLVVDTCGIFVLSDYPNLLEQLTIKRYVTFLSFLYYKALDNTLPQTRRQAVNDSTLASSRCTVRGY